MRPAHRTLLPALAALLMTFSLSAQPAPDREDWLPLFNGRDLSGWIPKIRGYETGQNFGNTFRVHDGLLSVRYDAYDVFDNRFGHIFYEKPFGYYRMRLTYRFVGEQAPKAPAWALRNSGVMIHGQKPESMLKDQDFPISIEVQLLGGDGEQARTTANLCTPGTHVEMQGKLVTDHCLSSASKTYHGEQWVTVELLVLGDSLIQHIVEGEVVLEYRKPQIGGGVVSGFSPAAKPDGTLLTGGSISLQSEGHPVDFREVLLLPLEGCMDPKADNYKSYYVKSRPDDCRYGGGK
jgi:hypothetical protein